MSAQDIDREFYEQTKKYFKQYNLQHLLVITKLDLLSQEEKEQLKKEFPAAVFTSFDSPKSVEKLKQVLIERLSKEAAEPGLLDGILEYGNKVIMVVPIDSEAPKGRLILPQVQVIRECLDKGIKSYVVRDTELATALDDLKNPDLIITDSQAFAEVKKIVGDRAPLTSFSILFANQKGDLNLFREGIESINNLKNGDKILILETCTHTTSHEDIGRVKIPNLLRKKTGKQLLFDFYQGKAFPENLGEYALVLHCGGCMINRRHMLNRIETIKGHSLPITNYGVVLAYLSGILEDSLEIFNKSGS
jgi:[FeFe] hydrogenase H-cluster maturation GTPase HydF